MDIIVWCLIIISISLLLTIVMLIYMVVGILNPLSQFIDSLDPFKKSNLKP